MKKIIIAATFSFLSVAQAQTSDCMKEVEAIEDKLFNIALHNLPSTAVPNRQGPDYQLQYGIMLGVVSKNFETLKKALEDACKDSKHYGDLVRQAEVNP